MYSIEQQWITQQRWTGTRLDILLLQRGSRERYQAMNAARMISLTLLFLGLLVVPALAQGPPDPRNPRPLQAELACFDPGRFPT